LDQLKKLFYSNKENPASNKKVPPSGRNMFFPALTGCAAPPPATYGQSENQVFYMRDDLQKVRKEVEGRKKKLETAKLKEEIDLLNKEIADLQARMADMEKDIADAEKKQTQQVKSPSYVAPTGTNVGPRGGCYTITKSGKKNYKGC
jgi:septal ring factor EnvC (AmiA/AmiB activator)